MPISPSLRKRTILFQCTSLSSDQLSHAEIPMPFLGMYWSLERVSVFLSFYELMEEEEL